MHLVILFFLIGFWNASYAKNYEIEADAFEYDEEKQLLIAHNNASAFIEKYKVKSDLIIYNLKDKEIKLKGNVNINHTTLNTNYYCQSSTIDLTNNKISMKQTQGQFKDSKISAKLLQYNQEVYQSHYTTITLCNTCKNQQKLTPFWQIRAKKLISDNKDSNEIKMYNVYLDIFDKQVAYIPFLSLPMSWTQGKSGFLMPKLQNKGLGYQIDLPFYFKASKNLDFTFYPAIGAKSIYGLNTRYKVANGGYETTIYTGSLTTNKAYDTTKPSIFTVWPANIKLNSNIFYPLDKHRCDNKKGYEFGLTGELALGAKPILLYKYDISDRKILATNIYSNATYANIFTTLQGIHLHNLKLQTRTIALPKINIYNSEKIQLPYNFFSTDPEILTYISTNNIYNETFTKRVSDTLAQVKFITKHHLDANNKLTYATQLTGYKATNNYNNSQKENNQITTTLNIHYQSKLQHNRALIEPHAILNLQKVKQPLFTIDQSQVDNEEQNHNIYSTTNNINPNNIFANESYTTGNRSIMSKNGSHFDYGFILSTPKSFITTNKLFWTVGSRQYLGQQSQFKTKKTYNQDIALANLQEIFKEKYISQLSIANSSFSIANRTWFTSNFSLLTNEFYLDKNFNKLTTSIQHTFFNSKYNFDQSIEQKKLEQHIKLQVKYNLTENLSTTIKNTIKLGQNKSGKDITEVKHIKGQINYTNECIQIGFAIKKEFDKGKYNANNNLSSYNLYVKIPTI